MDKEIPINWDRLEQIGHEFTLVDGPSAGKYIYFCENCGVLMIVGGGGFGSIEIWHHPERQDRMCSPKPTNGENLSDKLKKMRLEKMKIDV